MFTTKTTWHGDRMATGAIRGTARGATRGAEHLRGTSAGKAPVDQGPLGASASVIPATVETMQAAVTFDTPYAVVQHEDETLNHTEGANGEPAGEAHYLSGPLVEDAPVIVGLMARGMRDGIAAAV